MRARPAFFAPSSFNPCFDGSEARDNGQTRGDGLGDVSILVLMEVKREDESGSGCGRGNHVSILVLMEVKRE